MYDTPIFQALYDIGLDNLQAQLYYDLLLNPRMTISELAKDYGVHREKIYLASQKLVDIGLATYPKSSKKINIESPSKIYILLKQKKSHFAKTEKDFVDVLPDLLPLYMTEIQKPIVQLYEGIDNFFGVFDQFIEEAKGEILCFTNPHHFHSIIGLDYLNNWIAKRVQKSLAIRIITSKTDMYGGVLNSREDQLRQIRFLQDIDSFKATFYISGDRIAIWNSSVPKAVSIQDRVIVETFRFMFDSIWNGLGES
jgi:HTH-type transcriptional regulator, sugar sensing transcriptional regulator